MKKGLLKHEGGLLKKGLLKKGSLRNTKGYSRMRKF